MGDSPGSHWRRLIIKEREENSMHLKGKTACTDEKSAYAQESSCIYHSPIARLKVEIFYPPVPQIHYIPQLNHNTLG